MSELAHLRVDLAAAGDPAKAVQQERSMTSAMPYDGPAAPELRAHRPPYRRSFAPGDRAEWERVVRNRWVGATHRHEWYVATVVTLLVLPLGFTAYRMRRCADLAKRVG